MKCCHHCGKLSDNFLSIVCNVGKENSNTHIMLTETKMQPNLQNNIKMHRNVSLSNEVTNICWDKIQLWQANL